MKALSTAILVLACGTFVSCGKKTNSTDGDLQVLSLPLSGTWTGSGSESSDGAAATACSSITVTLTFTASQVTISNFSSTCGGATEAQSTLTLSTANGQLSENGVVLGTVSDNDIHLQYSDGQGNSYNAEFTLQDATHVTYSENDSGGGHTFTGSGTLVKQ